MKDKRPGEYRLFRVLSILIYIAAIWFLWLFVGEGPRFLGRWAILSIVAFYLAYSFDKAAGKIARTWEDAERHMMGRFWVKFHENQSDRMSTENRPEDGIGPYLPGYPPPGKHDSEKQKREKES